MSVDEGRARELLIQGAQRIGWSPPPDAPLPEVEAYLFSRIAKIEGAQDRSHAKNGIRSAIAAAHEGNEPYVAGGLWEARKVLFLHHHDNHPEKLPS